MYINSLNSHSNLMRCAIVLSFPCSDGKMRLGNLLEATEQDLGFGPGQSCSRVCDHPLSTSSGSMELN